MSIDGLGVSIAK